MWRGGRRARTSVGVGGATEDRHRSVSMHLAQDHDETAGGEIGLPGRWIPCGEVASSAEDTEERVDQLAAPDKVDDFKLIAFANLGCFERGAPQHHEVVLDGYAPGVDLE